MKGEVVMVLGSLQNHAAIVDVRGGGGKACPCIGTTDFGLPKIIVEYEL